MSNILSDSGEVKARRVCSFSESFALIIPHQFFKGRVCIELRPMIFSPLIKQCSLNPALSHSKVGFAFQVVVEVVVAPNPSLISLTLSQALQWAQPLAFITHSPNICLDVSFSKEKSNP